jgi:LmbE family N-acetylglucosaminyl deacetylase
LQVFQADIIVTPYPALDWHTDHKLATRAVITAIKEGTFDMLLVI